LNGEEQSKFLISMYADFVKHINILAASNLAQDLLEKILKKIDA
jgi:hypothetical protein